MVWDEGGWKVWMMVGRKVGREFGREVRMEVMLMDEIKVQMNSANVTLV